MQELTDAQLLRDYAEHRNEAAFRELVRRHADVVYASALRQVSSPDLAHDITQSVFTDLACKAQPLARMLTRDASLLGWLFRSTRFLALNQMRDDRRRQARERHVMQHFDPASDTAPEWERVQPVLDEAMADLSDEDRDALLLRFFKNRDFRAIGTALGVSDDAAQKRVSRALERLRNQLTSRGVTTSAGALSALLVAETVSFAPAGLAATLSTTALAGITLAATATAIVAKAIAMTTLQKSLISATLVAAVGPGIYEAHQASRLRDQLQTLREQQAEQIQQLMREREEAAGKLAGRGAENERLNRNTAELLKLRGETTRLRGELKRAELIAKSKLDAERGPSVAEQARSNPPPVETYSATARAVVPWNQALITGGWQTLSGKIVYVLAVPTRTENAAVVMITAHVMEASVEAAAKFGLDQSNTGKMDTQSSAILTTERFESIVKAANNTNDVAILDSPRVTVSTGNQAGIQSLDNKETSAGEKYSVGPSLTFMPKISADGQSVDLGMVANVNYPSPAASQ